MYLSEKAYKMLHGSLNWQVLLQSGALRVGLREGFRVVLVRAEPVCQGCQAHCQLLDKVLDSMNNASWMLR